MARNRVRDERQGDLFGAPPPPAKPVRRTSLPKAARDVAPPLDPVSLGNLGAKATRPEIDEFLDGMPDQGLAYLAVEATRLMKRRLSRRQGRGPRPKGPGQRPSPLDDALRRIGGELMEVEDPGEAW
jgi:hypothetical protein